MDQNEIFAKYNIFGSIHDAVAIQEEKSKNRRNTCE